MTGPLIRQRILIALLCFLVPLSAQAFSVKGQVVDQHGRAVEGALVFCAQDREARKTVSAADGAYHFDGISVRMMALVAWKPGYALGGQTSLPLGDMELNLILPAPGDVLIRVINNNFLSVAGARITSMMVNDLFHVPVDELVEAGFPLLRSDDKGLLDLSCVPAGGYVKLTLAHHHYADSSIAYLPVDTRRRDLVLYEGVRLRGRITVEGEAVPRARISLFQQGVEEQKVFAEAFSDPEGYYHLRAPEDSYLLVAHHREYAAPQPQQVLLRSGEESVTADIALTRAHVIGGTILQPDNKPCPGARVLFRVDDTVFEEAISDSTGAFELRIGRADGIIRVVPPPGFMTEILADIPVQLGETRQTTLPPIKLKALPVVRGKALFPEGIPAEKLYLHSLDLPAPIHMITREDGSFEIHFFYQPEQKNIFFRLEHPFRFLRRDFAVVLDQPSEIEVLLESFEPDLERRPAETGRNDMEALLGKEAPPIVCADWFNSQPLSLEKLKGKVVVLTFWGGFDNSIFAMNRLREMQSAWELYKDQEDVMLIGIHDASNEADEIAEYIRSCGLTFPVGKDDDPFVSFVNYGINYIPQTVIIDKQSTVHYTQVEGRLFELIKALRRRP
ncbi:MAG: redoxin domain-containing protein [Candidatus Hydrogenedens sp.]|nr:redoxin domain-containing protein [Candidatus Hydrogenedens sp.]